MPILAVVAYITVLRVGLLADDFVLLFSAETNKLTPQLFLPSPGWVFYRPISFLLTWQLGWTLWGANPLPYHIISLLLHAANSLVLGLWLATATKRQGLGFLAAGLFAVFPLHLEAVGWIASQWDEWAALFGLLSLWLFTLWWIEVWVSRVGATRSPTGAKSKATYLMALLCYGLGIFSKESLISWIFIMGMAAWLVTPIMKRQHLVKIALALVPFAGMLALNLALRFFTWGGMGGYSNVRTDYPSFFWDGITYALGLMLSPINRLSVGVVVSQVVGAFSALGLLVALVLFGRRVVRLLLFSATWILLTVLPVLNLFGGSADLQQNRLLYLPIMGYCITVAALLYTAIQATKGARRKWAIGGAAMLLALAITFTWLQLRPWHTATVQLKVLTDELVAMITPMSPPRALVWYVENIPDTYEGAYLVRIGADGMWHYNGGLGVPHIEAITTAEQAPLARDPGDTFSLRFTYAERSNRFLVDYAGGYTRDNPPPTSEPADNHLTVWDFRNCASGVVGEWKAGGAGVTCRQSNGLIIQPTSDDPSLVSSAKMGTNMTGVRFVRLRASASYAKSAPDRGLLNQWYWAGSQQKWSEPDSLTLPLGTDGKSHIYWTFIPLDKLRLDTLGIT
ncbi:MAG: hypothetical protein M3014_02345, partial [Chloroflexota bacterium]|nr:hypothetical protein [Chloroflexota bacterium]